jgi:hypothetical protein
VWAYIQVLNAAYKSIVSDKTKTLIPFEPDAKILADAGAHSNKHDFKQRFEPYLTRLKAAHAQAVEKGRWSNTIKQIWINVIGFSRGAAAARAFVHRLVNEWAPGGKLIDATGKDALPYQINFMGLFDTVASVGLPDSFRAALNLERFDGHAHFASDGGLAIPDSVRYCVHAFSIHEQRMSFPLDSIRQAGSYAGGEVRREIAYPGVHSDVGGGYGPGDQGKGCDSSGKGMDERKLSQIALHDMYIAALSFGVPLMKAEAILNTPGVSSDFALHADTIAAFNAWLETTSRIDRIEDAMRFGMEQMLSWRALRAQVEQGSYITNQKFFDWAREDALTPYKVKAALQNAEPNDPQLRELNARKDKAQVRRALADAKGYPANVEELDEVRKELAELQRAIDTRTDELCAEVAYPGAAVDERPESGRPGEGPLDITTNEKTDLRQSAEEMRLLLAYLHPDDRQTLKVDERVMPVATSPNRYPEDAPAKTLFVKHGEVSSDTPGMSLVNVSAIKFHAARTAVMREFNVADDVLPKPLEDITPFLKRHTSRPAFERLPDAVITLFDRYVHDSRCWFRVPYFHEYTPGGYGWPRIVFSGEQRLPWLASDSLSVALQMFEFPEAAVA